MEFTKLNEAEYKCVKEETDTVHTDFPADVKAIYNLAVNK